MGEKKDQDEKNGEHPRNGHPASPANSINDVMGNASGVMPSRGEGLTAQRE
jgi:hypothetical protein